MVDNELEIASHCPANLMESLKSAVDGKTFEGDAVRAKISPEPGPLGCVDLGINADLNFEMGVSFFDQFEKIWGGNRQPRDSHIAHFIEKSIRFFLPPSGPFTVAKAGAVEEVVEFDALLFEFLNIGVQGFPGQWSCHLAGSAATDDVRRIFPVDFFDRITGELRNQPGVVIGSHA